MKKIITLFSMVGLLAACKTGTEKPIASDDKMLTISEAAEFAEFTEWKSQKAAEEQKKNSAVYTQDNKPTIVYVTKPVETRTVVRERNTEVASSPAPVQTVSQPVAKKRWSKAAKGAVIGAGTGAVAGAVIAKKNRVLGAVIGGVAGGGVGYGIGRGMDKRDARNDFAFAGF
jgi:hypothetical protein